MTYHNKIKEQTMDSYEEDFLSEEKSIESQKILEEINNEVVDSVTYCFASFFDKRTKKAVENKQYHIQLELLSITYDLNNNTSNFLPEFFVDRCGIEPYKQFKNYLEETIDYLYEKYVLLQETHDFKQKFIEYVMENVGLKCVHNYKFLEETFLQ